MAKVSTKEQHILFGLLAKASKYIG